MSRAGRPDSRNMRKLKASIAAGTALTDADWKDALGALSDKQHNLIETMFAMKKHLGRRPTQAEIAAELGIKQKNVSEMFNRIQKKLPGLLLIANRQASAVNEA